MAGNEFTDDVAPLIASGIGENYSLKTFNISHNELGAKTGGKIIGHSLGQCMSWYKLPRTFTSSTPRTPRAHPNPAPPRM